MTHSRAWGECLIGYLLRLLCNKLSSVLHSPVTLIYSDWAIKRTSVEYTSLLRYIVTGQTILHYGTRKINNFARQLAIVVERIVSGKAVRQQANTIVPMINWVAGAAAGEVLCLHYKDGDGDFGLNMKSLFIAEVSFVLNTNNTTHFSHRIYNFVLFQMHGWEVCCLEAPVSREHAWARVQTEPQPRPPAGDPQHPRADLLQALILLL